MTAVRIVNLQAENVMRLVAVSITPDGNVVTIAGKNGAGKTSVMNAISMALGGRALCPEKPLRAGEESGFTQVTLSNGWVVKRTFTAGGNSYLTVTTEDGARFQSPQAMLDKLLGELSFDPLAFSRMSARDQRDALQRLVGLDFSDHDRERARVFDERTAVNRTAKQLEARLVAMPQHADAPEEEVSVAALTDELEGVLAAERQVAERRRHVEDLETQRRAMDERTAAIRREVEDLRARIAKLEDEAQGIGISRTSLTAAINQCREDVERDRRALRSPEPLRERIRGAEAANAKLRANRLREECAAELEGVQAEAARLTGELEALDATKETALAAAKFPVEGLSFDETGVLLNGLPFSQASSAEQLRVSVAMGLAMNPRLRVLLVRDASLLDEDSLRLVAEMADSADAQVWLERVGDGGECTVVIEDGTVRGAEAAA